MKEISEKLAKELLDIIEQAEVLAAKAVTSARSGHTDMAEGFAISASVAIFNARTHLEWHIEGYKHVEK